jgi:hypothetical protein
MSACAATVAIDALEHAGSCLIPTRRRSTADCEIADLALVRGATTSHVETERGACVRAKFRAKVRITSRQKDCAIPSWSTGRLNGIKRVLGRCRNLCLLTSTRGRRPSIA